MICDEHLELLLDLVPGDGGVGHDVVHILLGELHVGVLSPPLDPGLGQNVQSFVGLFLHYGNSHQASMCGRKLCESKSMSRIIHLSTFIVNASLDN